VNWIEELKQRIDGDVSTDQETLKEHSTDASIFKVQPQVVVFPKHARDVEGLVRFANEKRDELPDLSFAPRAAGTCMSGGPLTESVVVSFKKYFTDLFIDGLEATVEPGAMYTTLEEIAKKDELIFASYPASKSISTLGGSIMNNAGGEKSLRYGKTEKHVHEMNMVFANGKEYSVRPLTKTELEEKMAQNDYEGELYKKVYELIEKDYNAIQKARPSVSKNSAGYNLWDVWDRETFDLTKLFVGSQGTLGFMTSAKVGLVKKKTKTRLGVLFLRSWEQLPDMVNELLPYDPESLEIFDDHVMMLVLKFFPEIAKKVPGENLFSLAWKFFPEFLIGVRMLRVPKLVVLVQFAEDTDEAVEQRVKDFKKVTKRFGVASRVMHTEAAAEKYWIIRRESFALLRKIAGKRRTVPFIDDFIVEPKYLPEVLPKVMDILKEYNIQTTLTGHAGSGNMHLIPLMDLGKEEEKKKIPVVMDLVNNVVLEHGGSVSAEHNGGYLRGPYIEKQFGKKVYSLFREVKQIFDPNGIFNPGKKIDVDFEKALGYIDPRR